MAVTFDDGYRSVLDEAVPVLQRYGFPAVCFVPTRWIGEANGWDTFKPTDRALPILSAEGLVERLRFARELRPTARRPGPA